MQKVWIAIVCLLALAGSLGAAEVTPEELLNAVDQMSSEQAYEFAMKLESKVWEPVPEGFFSRLAVGLSITASEFDDVDLAGLQLSGGTLDLESVAGTELSMLWRTFNPRLRMGLRVGSFLSEDSDLNAQGYSQADLTGAYGAFVVNYQWVRRERWLVWSEVATGAAGMRLETVNTPAGQPTTLRILDGDFWLLDARAGVSWRFNRILSLFFSGGYNFSEEADLEEGGRSTPWSIDPAGASGQFGLGVNY